MGMDTAVSYEFITPKLTKQIDNILKVNYYHIGVFLDFDCPFSHTGLEEV